MTVAELEKIVAEARAAIEAGDLARAFVLLEPRTAELAHDPALAAVWLDALRVNPSRPSLVEDVERALACFPEDATLVTRACDALIRAAERIPQDEPPPRDSPARVAAEAAERCLRAGPARELEAYLHMSCANALRLVRDYDAALAACERALAIEPSRGRFWFNLGLLRKARGDFEAGLAANEKARELLGPDKATLWNLAICATALGRGAIAAEVWRALGLPGAVAGTGMPYVEGLPPLLVRAATVGSGLGPESSVPDRSVSFEQVWVTPLSPCHGVVSSATYRDAAIDYGDVVLWDGTPVALSEREGKPTPCFPLLAVLHRGTERRFRFVALEQQPGLVAMLANDLPERSRLFIHHERIEHLCARCASGEHMRKHVHEPPEAHRLAYGKLVVDADVDLAQFRAALDASLRRHSGVQLVMPGLLEALGETAAAGKAHQMWRGLELRRS